jgi:hypothetical protein
MHNAGQHMALRIGHNMALAALDLLSRVIAAWAAALGRLDRLAGPRT